MLTHCKNGHSYTPENTYKNGAKGHYRCKQCKSDYMNRLLDDDYEKYEKRQEYIRQYQRTHKRAPVARIQEIKDYIRACKTACLYCHESHIACLDFHHREPNEKSFNMGSAHLCRRNIENVKLEIAKCDVICSNCHRKLHASFKEIE